MLKTILNVFYSIFLALFLGACAGNGMNEVKPVKQVDLPKFMGDWYVIAAIPTMIETQAYNAIENYQLNTDGTIATTFTYYKGAFDGPFKTYHPKGFVEKDTGNAIWGMQFIWPIKADFRIAYLDPDYQRTIIARNARDYVWIMARTPQIADADYDDMVQFVKDLGYDTSKIRKVPQSWPAPASSDKN
jgi:apolipoprotein D and lipocalin family protein